MDNKNAIKTAIDEAEEVPPAPDDAALAKLPRNDTGNARRLIARHGHEMAWVKGIGWVVWDGRRWSAEDGEERALECAQATMDAIRDEADMLPEAPEPGEKTSASAKHRAFASASGNSGKVEGALKMARPKLARKHDAFDARPWHFNTANGTLRLDQGVRLYPHRGSDLLTRISPVAYDPDADCPKFLAFIGTILPDRDTAIWVQKWLGYGLTGDITEQCIAIFQGKGANGKSTLMETIARVMGDYAGNVPIASFLHQDNKKGGEASPDTVRLRGARLIRTSEPEQGARLSESAIKQWTGGEAVTARELHQKFIDFVPSGKITMSCNPLPVIVGKDDGTRRRVRLVKFRHQFKKVEAGRKVDYAEMFVREEAAGILNWLLDGFRMWFEDGLDTPAQIQLDTDEYFTEQDPIGTFAKDVLYEADESEERRIQAATLYAMYEEWSKRHGEEPKKAASFGRRLKEIGIPKKQVKGRMFYVGHQVREDWRELYQAAVGP